jgi:hypothetical protein
MELERRLAKVARYHVALFVLPLLSLLYYGWWTASTLDQRPDNPLRLSPMALRGDIEDRAGKPLAHSEQEMRIYPLRAAAGPLVGYHLRGRNQSGLEALLQSALSPPAPPKSLWGALAMDRQLRQGHPPLKGPSVRLTLDSGLQGLLYQKFGSRAGVVVVADLVSGEILAAVSGPSFDPNEIARDWQQLRADPRSPLIERVGGGLYPVLSRDGVDLLQGQPSAGHAWFADNPFPDYPGASSAVDIDGVRLYSPLMLLQIAAQTEAGPATLQPRLLTAPGELAASKALVPSGGQAEDADGLQLLTLQGPKFRQSPPFQVLLGRRAGARPLVFAIVAEGPTQDMGALRQDLLPVLRRWPDP